MQKPKRVFISHSSKDRDFVEGEIISLLQSHGIDTWYSTDDIQTAERWERSIRKALKECDWFLVVVSERSIDSVWVQREVSWADRHRKGRIIPVVLDGSEPSDLSLVLEGLQHVKFGLDVQDARVRLFKTWGMQVAIEQEKQPKNAPPPRETTRHTQSTTAAKPKPTHQPERRKEADRIKVQCPNGHRIRADGALRGKRVRCPKCSTQFVVPMSGEQAMRTASTKSAAVLQPHEVYTNSIGMKLALIPAGEFLMGSPESDEMARVNERPQHQVEISKPFCLGVHPATQDEYEKVAGSNPSFFYDGVRRPVEQVSWLDAVRFCNALSLRESLPPYYRIDGETVSILNGGGYRLPAEAEWEYACRAGTTTRWSFGDDESQLGEHAWYGANSGDTSHSAGEKKPNPWGLHDMHGNVWEWCWDGYGDYTARSVTDPLGPENASRRVLRGGSFNIPTSVVRSACRAYSQPDVRSLINGFRVARTYHLSA